MPVKLEPIPKSGTTKTRKEFWDEVREAVIQSQKIAGRDVSISEYYGKGTVINVQRATPTPPPVGAGACCEFDGSCNDVEDASLCVAPAVFHAGESCAGGFRCEGACAVCGGCPNSCFCDETLTYAECQEHLDCSHSVGWLLGGNCVDNNCDYFFESTCAPSTAEPPVGACCAFDGICFCVEGITEAECALEGGTQWCDGGSCFQCCCYVTP